MSLPPLPRIAIRVVEEPRSPDPTRGFLRLRRQVLVARYPDGAESEPFTYDAVDRAALDAVIIAAHYRDAAGTKHVFLRSAVRPPLLLRAPEVRPIPEKDTLGALWELPAGLVEPSERSVDGLRRCAARELREEIGFEVDAARVAPLGPSTFPAPGMVGERQFFFHVEVDPATRGAPTEDGSALERGGVVVAVPLDEALSLVRSGAIEDAKSEIALRRLAEV
jgi:ADP-ribose pyrophosphatase